MHLRPGGRGVQHLPHFPHLPHLCARPVPYLQVVTTLSDNKCSKVPVLSCHPFSRGMSPTLLADATISSVLACLLRWLRTSKLKSLPLLGLPLCSLSLGTWCPHAEKPLNKDTTVRRLHTVTPDTPLTTALSMLLETGVSALPVVDEKRHLLDVYAKRWAALFSTGALVSA